MVFQKLEKFSKKVSDLSDSPSQNMTPAEIKSVFDTPPEELRVKYNELVDGLLTEGSTRIGAKVITGLTNDNIHTQVESLKTLTDRKTDNTGDHKGSWQGLTPQMIGAPEMNSARITAAEEKLAVIAINVKSFGAIGDFDPVTGLGGTSDTVAIQKALTELPAGAKLILEPNKRYLITKSLIRGLPIEIDGNGSTFYSAVSSYDTLFIGGGVTASTDLTTYLNSSYYDNRITGVKVKNLNIQPSASARKATGIAVCWADDVEIDNCKVSESNGNGLDLRQCRNVRVNKVKIKGINFFGAFFFQNKNFLIENSEVADAQYSCEVKHCYNGEKDVSGTIRKNIFKDASLYYLTTGFNYEATNETGFYPVNHQYVENLVIENNTFIQSSIEAKPPTIGIRHWSSNVLVDNNTFIAISKVNNIEQNTVAIGVGETGDPASEIVPPDGNHTIRNNRFTGYMTPVLFRIGADVEFDNNVIEESEIRSIWYPSDQLGLAGYRPRVKKLRINKAIVKVDAVTAPNAEGILKTTDKFDNVDMKNSEFYLNALYKSSNSVHFAYLASDKASMSGVTVKYTGQHASITNSDLIVVSSKTFTAESVEIVADSFSASTVLRAIVVSGTIPVRPLIKNSKITATGTWAGTTGIQTSVETSISDIIFTGITNTISDTSGGKSLSGLRRLVYASAAPTVGAWATGDIVIRTTTSQGLSVGWQCVASGTPGTWVPFGQVGVLQAITAIPSFVGQIAVVSGIAYIAIGTTATTHWKQIT